MGFLLHCCRATTHFVLLSTQTYLEPHAKCSTFLSDFHKIWSFSTDFRGKSPISGFTKFRPAGFEKIHPDKRTDIQKYKRRFERLMRKRLKKTRVFRRNTPQRSLFVSKLNLTNFKKNFYYFKIQIPPKIKTLHPLHKDIFKK